MHECVNAIKNAIWGVDEIRVALLEFEDNSWMKWVQIVPFHKFQTLASKPWRDGVFRLLGGGTWALRGTP